MVVLRPADATETTEAWKLAVSSTDGPTVIVLSRQNLPLLDREKFAPSTGVQNGAYILHDSPSPAKAIILSTGSEIEIAIEAGELLASEDIPVRIVSMTSWELFDKQPLTYQQEVCRHTLQLVCQLKRQLIWDGNATRHPMELV